MSVPECVDKDRAPFGFHRPNHTGLFALALNDLSASIGRWRRPGNDEDTIQILSRYALCKLDLDRRSRQDDALDGGAQVGVEIDGAKALDMTATMLLDQLKSLVAATSVSPSGSRRAAAT